jgi:hypothetical protein
MILGPSEASGVQDAKGKQRLFLTVDADLKSLKSDRKLALLPWEIYSSFIERIIGLDLLAEDSIHVAFGYEKSGEWLAAVTSTRSKDLQLSDLAKRRFTMVKDADGAKLEDIRRFSDSDILVKKVDQVWYVGTEQALTKFADAEDSLVLWKEQALSNSRAIFSIVIRPEPLREQLVELVMNELDEDVTDAKAISQLCRWTDELRFEVFSGRALSARLTLRPIGGVAAAELDPMVRRIQLPNLIGLEKFVQRRVSTFRLSQREQFAWETYVARLRHTLEVLQPKVDDNQIEYELGALVSVPVAALMGQSVLGTLEYNRLSNERFSSQYKLRELNEAIEKLMKEKGSFPLREILSEEGESLLSWRVALLPYLGYESLYNKFRLNERWDSPHNIELLKLMPSIYRNSDTNLRMGYTTFVAPYGATDEKRKTVWDIVPQSFSSISERERESILLLEVNSEVAVPWSSPEDFNVSLQDLRSQLRDPPEGNGVVFINGNTDYISNAISTISLLELLNCSTEGKP